MRKTLWIGLLMLLSMPVLVLGQGATTAEFSGIILSSDEMPLPGAEVTAVHVPTGTTYTTISRADGRFNIPAVRVGGPYTVTVTMEGFKTDTANDVYVKLGENKQLSYKLVLANVDLGEVTVVASEAELSTARTGAAHNVSQAAIENMPSISRNFSDFTRLVPQVNISENFSDQAYSVAGKNNRYNNVQIDGAVNNDLFGLADSGSPGGQAGTNPISLDAIQEFQIVIAPYDVRQGGFTGGGINAITRSGTNQWHGSVFYYGRWDALVGKGEDDTPVGEFKEQQYGFRLGGPIMKDKFFFFVNGEITRRSQPNDYLIDDSGNSNDWGGAAVSLADVQRFLDICAGYGYDPGGYGEYTARRDSNKFFGRADFNINDKHRLTARFNWVDALSDILSRAGNSFSFGNAGYTMENDTYSTVGQLDSVIGDNMANEFRINYTIIRDARATPGDRFPNVSVSVNGYTMVAGTERYSTANSLDQDVLEITDNLSFFLGKHTLVIGTHNEIFDFSNVFIRDNFGTYRFSNLNNFEAGLANRYELSFSNIASEPRWAAEFGVAQLGFYIGDTYQMRPNLNLTFGLRMDVPIIGDEPSYNELVEDVFGIDTREMASGNILWSPRLGFNWDMAGDGKSLLRGGVGVFSGRTPYVWISNQFGNTGIEFTRYYVTGSSVPAFVADPDNQPKGFAVQTSEINVMDKDFLFPQVARINLAYDRELPWGLKGTVEGIFTQNISDVLIQNINLVQTANDAWDRRAYYGGRRSSAFSDVIYLKNTNEGFQYSLSFSLQRRLPNNGFIQGAYNYGGAQDVNSGSSSQARSNFQYNHIGIDANRPSLTASNQDIRHRIGIGVSYVLDLLKKHPTTLTVFYNGRSGRAYSSRFYDDENNDGSLYNDLIYVPRSEDEIILTGGTWADLNAYIEGDEGLSKYRGQIIPRNASYEPWYHRADFRLLQDFSIPGLEGHKLQFSWDIQNFLNLFNSSWGKYQYVYYRGDAPMSYGGVDSATGKPKYAFLKTGTNRYDTDIMLSRWQMQFGIRYIF